MKMKIPPVVRSAGVALSLAACSLLLLSSSAVAQGAPDPITMNADTFDRTEVHIAPGQTVTWNNPDAQTHTVTADDGSFDSGDVVTGDQFQMEFDTPGTYPYFCGYHGGPGGQGMAGVIVVDGN